MAFMSIKICGIDVKFTGFNSAMPINDRITLKETIANCLKQYNLDTDLKNGMFSIENIELSKRLKTTAGICKARKSLISEKYIFSISLAYNNFKEFGIDSIDKVLRHEMAHLIEIQKYGSTSHGERFKKICVALGGSMNSQQAGAKYKSNATNNFCTTKKKYTYKCSCGIAIDRQRKITSKSILFGTCKNCGTLVMDMKLIKN